METLKLTIAFIFGFLPLAVLGYAAYQKLILPYIEEQRRKTLSKYYQEIAEYYDRLEKEQELIRLSQSKTVINFHKITDSQAVIAKTSQLLNQTFDVLKETVTDPAIQN